jgi:hypothetical protein
VTALVFFAVILPLAILAALLLLCEWLTVAREHQERVKRNVLAGIDFERWERGE